MLDQLKNPMPAYEALAARWLKFLPAAVAALALLVLLAWLMRGPGLTLTLRTPGADAPPGASATAMTNAVLAGELIAGPGRPPEGMTAIWPGFRGGDLTGIVREPGVLARDWGAGGPKALWSVEVGEGYAGAAVFEGRVFVMDYDREAKRDALRCLSLADGQELWRYAYPVSVKRNHGMSRTIPTVTRDYVVAMGPKCHLVCLDTMSGELRWGRDLVREYGAKVPPWYAGQCPLIEDEKVIVAPAGTEVMMTALSLESGAPVWETPNPSGWSMTHVSITPIEFAGRRIYVYCASRGVVGVDAATGEQLWATSDWKISIATVPSPVDLGGGRFFLSGGYNAGSLLMELQEQDGAIVPQTVVRLPPETFGSTQQTPVFYQGHIFGVRPDGKFVCLKEDGSLAWTSEAGVRFGIGPYLLAGDLFYLMDDRGTLTLAEASTSKYTQLAQAKVLDGRESWGPMTLVDGRLIARDLTRMVCLDVAAGN